MKGPIHNIASIFGQIEEVVALKMEKEGKLRIIQPREFPKLDATTQHIYVNDAGVPAKFAVIWTKPVEAEFDRRVAALRA